MSLSLRILIVEDNPGDADLLQLQLPEDGSVREVVCVPRLAAALDRVEAGDVDLVFLDLALPDSFGLDTLRRMRRQAEKLPVIVLTGNSDEETGLQAIREGAQDFLVKGELTTHLLARSIKYAVERSRSENALKELNDTLEQRVAERTEALLRANEALRSEIGERQRAEEEQRRVKEQWERTFASVPDLIAILDNHHRVLQVNEAMARRLGVEAQECVGVPCHQVVHGTSIPPEFCPHSRTVCDGRTHQEQVQVERFGGDFLVTTTPLLDEQGRSVGSVHIAHDISEHKRAEAELHASAQRLAALLDAQREIAAAGLEYRPLLQLILDIMSRLTGADGASLEVADGDEMVYEAASGLAEGFVGLRMQREGSLSGRCLTSGELKRADDSESDLRVDREACRKMGLRSLLVIPLRYGHHSFGVLKLMSRRVAGFDESAERTLRLMGEFLGVTVARQRAQAALKQVNEELERRVAERTAQLRERDQMLLLQSRQAAMGEMIGNIAHQWRQPLNALGMLIQEIPMVYEFGELDQRYVDLTAQRSMSIIRHMSRTIDDFRNFFRPDKEKVRFHVREEVKKTLSLIEAGFQACEIKVEVVGDGDPVVHGYPNEYSQVLLNILLNARDALVERRVYPPTVQIAIGERVVSVCDNAGGIPQEIIDKVFEPYFTTKGPHAGTGVGLFMSKNIIEKNMGGRLTVRNTEEGACFLIEVGEVP
ncbi:response regulator [Geomonas sp.]|uniref:response regulator n=1 Tax=Geomonas sp. TaxID=2651584 RepID=UPI002B473255|nr:response regulator [Geomonas sp.]HJV36449.1 response regulator [Geomonas sp.]